MFILLILLRIDDFWKVDVVHDVEVFGLVVTMMLYKDFDDVIALVNRGKGSFAILVCIYDVGIVREIVLGVGVYHGCMVFINRDCAKESTGHGSSLSVLIHGGSGRAGGGEEMGGICGVKYYM